MTGGMLVEVSRFNTAEWRDGLRRVATPSKIFLDLALEFSRRYRKAKEEIRAIDFSDLEQHALKILRDERQADPPAPTDAARVYHAQFAHVLVDEYQDINAVQDAILTLVSRECVAEAEQNLFCVGDVKQSIYRFRLAEPKRFLERGERFRNGEAKLGEVIDLQSNFRTRGPLIGVVNDLFARLMTKESAEILYDQSHALHAGLKYPANEGTDFVGAPVELHLLAKPPRDEVSADADGDDLDRSEREAVVIAKRIRELMGLEHSPRAKVFDKSSGEMREIRYRDMVILLRSMKVKADQFADQLRLAGIPVHSDSGTGFFESMEIRDVLSLLRLLDNQRQDVPMAAVLRSPLAKLPNAEDCLATVRLTCPDKAISFHEAVVRYAQTQRDEIAACLRDFLEQIAQWREMIHRRPLAEVLWTIYDSTGYLAFCAGLEDGEQRVANLISLHERARQFGTFQRQGLNRFMQFIRNLQEQSDLGQPSVASEAEDVVRIMSVHRSKGLEFPVVFLPDLGKRHNLADCRGMILVDREAYLGLQAVDEEKRIRYPSLPWVLAQDRLKRQLLAEELRVLYVAMTRAREHLILIGTGEEKAREQWEDWRHHAGALPSDFVLGCNSMLDWIGATTAPIEENRPGSFEIRLHEDGEVQALAGKMGRKPELAADRKGLANLEKITPPPPADAAADRVIERLTKPYKWAEFTEVSAVASVTGLTKTGRAAPGGESASETNLVSFDLELAAPRCVALERKATPTEVGSATHLVLQNLDFTRANDSGAIEKQMDAMAMRKLISAEQRRIVDIEAMRLAGGERVGAIAQGASCEGSARVAGLFCDAGGSEECLGGAFGLRHGARQARCGDSDERRAHHRRLQDGSGDGRDGGCTRGILSRPGQELRRGDEQDHGATGEEDVSGVFVASHFADNVVRLGEGTTKSRRNEATPEKSKSLWKRECFNTIKPKSNFVQFPIDLRISCCSSSLRDFVVLLYSTHWRKRRRERVETCAFGEFGAIDEDGVEDQAQADGAKQGEDDVDPLQCLSDR